MFYVLGSLLVIAAGVYFITKKRMDVEYMVNNAAPQAEPWDLTLFTCNTGGQTRCAVRCIRAEDLK